LIQVCPYQRKARQELLQSIQELDKERDPSTTKMNVVSLSESLLKEAGSQLLKGVVSSGK